MEKLSSKDDKFYTQNCEDVVRDIVRDAQKYGTKEGLEMRPREYHSRRNISSEILRSFVKLPIEITLADRRNGLVVTTGQKNAAIPIDVNSRSGNWDVETSQIIRREARFTLHNHLEFTSSPSTPDSKDSASHASEVDFIVGNDGITIHKRTLEESARSAFADTMDVTRDFRRTLFPSRVIARDIKSGRIQHFLTWDDPRVEVVCSYINDKSGKWKDYEKRMHL